MHPFEERSENGVVFINQERWLEQRWYWMEQYRCPVNKWRMQINLCYPRETLEEVPVERNPHSLGGYGSHHCFYQCEDWSTIFGAYPLAHDESIEEDDYQMIVESGNPDPVWGERITLFSTSCSIIQAPHETNPSNIFAYWRGLYWRVYRQEFLHSFPWGRVFYPLSQSSPINPHRMFVQRQIIWGMLDVPRIEFNWEELMTVEWNFRYEYTRKNPFVVDPSIYRHGL